MVNEENANNPLIVLANYNYDKSKSFNVSVKLSQSCEDFKSRHLSI